MKMNTLNKKIGIKGFSVVELAIAVTAFGLITAVLTDEYRHYTTVKATSDTQARVQQITQAMARYVYNFHQMPCPAAPSAAPDTLNAGKGDCSIFAATPYVQWPKCNPATNICITEGRRNVSGVNMPHKDPVIIGTLPYVDLGISVKDSLDGWGNRFTYAVSYYDTDSSYFTTNSLQDWGVVGEEYYDRASDSMKPKTKQLTDGTSSPDAFMFAVVSHGPDGKGAWNYYGVRSFACDMTPIDTGTGGTPSPTSTGRDNENCNQDALFLDPGNDQNTSVYSRGTGPFYYDDALVMTDITLAADKWTTPTAIGDISNKSGGKVGIGVLAPQYPVDVSGNIRADGVQTTKICDSATNNCFDQSLVSPGVVCSGMMTGVASSSPTCQDKINAGTVTASSCPAGQFVVAISGGVVQCRAQKAQ